MIEEIRVAIVDDEEFFSQLIATILTDAGFIVAWIAYNFEDAAIQINKNEFDVLLLDINLQRRNSGIELGKIVCNSSKKPYIYVTSSIEPSVITEAVSSRPSAYLIKPVQPAALIATLHCAINNHQNNTVATADTVAEPEIFFVKTGLRYKKVNWRDVGSLKADGNYTIIYNYAENCEYTIRSPLFKAVQYLVPLSLQPSFKMISRNMAVRFDLIQELYGNEVKTGFGTFKVTETFLPGLRNAMNILA